MSKIIHAAVFATLLALLASPPSVLADDSPEVGIQLGEGLWLFDVSILAPMQSQPATQKLTTCMTDEPLTAETLMPFAEAQGCKIRGVKAKEDELSWKLRCKVNGQKARGRGKFSVTGKQGTGKATVKFEMGGRPLSIVTKWDARRVGPCPDGSTTDFTPEIAPDEDE